MIQRKQTLYFLLATLAYIMLFFLNIYNLETVDPALKAKLFAHKVEIEKDGLVETTSLLLPTVLMFLIIAGSLVAIFLFKNRQLQSKVSQFLLLVGIGVMVTMFFSLDKVTELANNPEEPTTSYTVWVAMLALPLIFFFLANKAIIADEKMVKEADRLR